MERRNRFTDDDILNNKKESKKLPKEEAKTDESIAGKTTMASAGLFADITQGMAKSQTVNRARSYGGGYGYKGIGLQNIGNTCFMNSTLQCVMAAGPLTEYFLSGQFEKDRTPKTKICNTYCQLLMGVRQAGGGSVTPSDIKKAVSKVAP